MTSPVLRDRYIASMVLSGVGDALGYYNGRWEFCHSGEEIHKELKELGGIDNIKVKLPSWPVSDDTVMHLATAEALIETGRSTDMTVIYDAIMRHYKKCMRDMSGRAPGPTCMNGVHMLRPGLKNGHQISFNERGGGCGAAMRAMCIGLRYPRSEDLEKLIEISIESGRMTHHHPTGFLGSFAAALFVSYAIQGKPLKRWGASMLSTLPRCLGYIKSSKYCVTENENHWGYFTKTWKKYLEDRNITDGESEPVFPEKYGVKERDYFVKSVSFSGWGGSSGHDAPMIAYDALLAAGKDWKELCSRSMFHAGDSDSTGVIAAACYGAMYGYEGLVPPNNYKKLEYVDRLRDAADKLFTLSQTDCDVVRSSSPVDSQEKLVRNRCPGPIPSAPSIDEFEDDFNDEASASREHEKPPITMMLPKTSHNE